ncbi:MAG: hypothetical protein ACKO2P_16215 [Planctomycetota bacterium]
MTDSTAFPNSSAFPQRVLRSAVLSACLLSGAGCGESRTPSAGASAGPALPAGIASPSVMPPSPAAGMMNTPFVVPPVTDPPMLAATEAGVGADEMVIGVSSEGISRAWLVSALSEMHSHVVIDTRGPQPIAVTFCDRSRCARVLAGEPGRSLRVQTAGFISGEMWLQVDGRMLPQSSPEIRLKDIERELMTWQEWKKVHPETTLFRGRPAEAAE